MLIFEQPTNKFRSHVKVIQAPMLFANKNSISLIDLVTEKPRKQLN